MWKIFFEYSDGSKCTLTGKHKDIPLRLAIKYQSEYGVHACKSTYQQYPKSQIGGQGNGCIGQHTRKRNYPIRQGS